MRTTFLIILLFSLFTQCNNAEKETNEKFSKRTFAPREKHKPSLLKVSENEEDIPVNEYLKETLAPIRANFKRINSVKEWSLEKSHELHESTEGGEARFYYHNRTFEKIVERHYGETGQLLREYYLLDGKLSFVYEKSLDYNRPITWDEEQRKEMGDTEAFDMEKSEIMESRSYFQDGKLIHQLESGDCGAPFAEDYLKEVQVKLMNNFNELLKLEE